MSFSSFCCKLNHVSSLCASYSFLHVCVVCMCECVFTWISWCPNSANVCISVVGVRVYNMVRQDQPCHEQRWFVCVVQVEVLWDIPRCTLTWYVWLSSSLYLLLTCLCDRVMLCVHDV